MTLDEAIIHLNDIVNKTIILKENVVNDDGKKVCDDFIEEYSQLAEWLKELKAFRQAKTKILEAIEELRENAKYHAYPIQDNTEMVIFGAEMALNIIDNKHN